VIDLLWRIWGKLERVPQWPNYPGYLSNAEIDNAGAFIPRRGENENHHPKED
jgi:hypothetical protein